MRSTDPQTGSSITPGFLPLPPFALSYDIPVSFLPSNDCPLDFFLPLSSPFVPLFHRLGSLRFPLVFSLSLSPFFFSVSPRARSLCLFYLQLAFLRPCQLLQPPTGRSTSSSPPQIRQDCIGPIPFELFSFFPLNRPPSKYTTRDFLQKLFPSPVKRYFFSLFFRFIFPQN